MTGYYAPDSGFLSQVKIENSVSLKIKDFKDVCILVKK
jgi:hypothetical protein